MSFDYPYQCGDVVIVRGREYLVVNVTASYIVLRGHGLMAWLKYIVRRLVLWMKG